jgi:hypothetical protein
LRDVIASYQNRCSAAIRHYVEPTRARGQELPHSGRPSSP